MDKAKKLLMLYEQSGKRKTMESAPPLTFKGYGKNLKNYRIYGNTISSESVGDLIESGEHSGEYVVPVKIEGKNLLQNTATSQNIRGITFTINGDSSVTCNGTLTPNNDYADLAISGVFLGDTDILENGNYTISCTGSEYALMIVGNSGGELGRTQTSSTEVNISGNLTWVILRVRKADPAITVYPMICRAEIADGTYEPYQAPVTTNLYLPDQIKMVGDEAEYIDFMEQKQHFADGTSIDVALPSLPTLSGTNTLSVGTTIQPSNITITGKIKQI